MWESFQLRFAGALEGGDSATEAAQRLGALVEQSDEFLNWFEHTGVHSWMSGQLMVRSVELEDERGAPGTVTLALDPAAFVSLAFDEAIAFFAAKRIVSPAAFDAIRDRFRRGAFMARRLAAGRMQEVAQRVVASVIEGGATSREAANAIRAGEVSLGISPSDPTYVNTVIRTNIATSYGAGRYDAMRDPDVVRLRPWWLYLTANDARVRPAHAALNGKVFRAESAEGNKYYPPLGYNCRCAMITQSDRQLARRGIRPESGPVIEDGKIVEPDAGFEDPPQPLET